MCNKSCGSCQCEAPIAPSVAEAVARAGEIWSHPDNTEAHRPALAHPLEPATKANVDQSLAGMSKAFKAGEVKEAWLAALQTCYEQAMDSNANRLANAVKRQGKIVRVFPHETELFIDDFPLGKSGVAVMSARFVDDTRSQGFHLKDFYGEKYPAECAASVTSFIAALGEKDVLTLLANLNDEVASGRLTFHFEDTTTTTYGLFTAEGTAVAGFSVCLDIRSYCPLLGMVYAARQIADKLQASYVLDSRSAAVKRIKEQARVTLGFAKQYAATFGQ